MTIKTIKDGDLEFIKVYHVRVRDEETVSTYLSFLSEQKAENCASRLNKEGNVTAWVVSELIFA